MMWQTYNSIHQNFITSVCIEYASSRDGVELSLATIVAMTNPYELVYLINRRVRLLTQINSNVERGVRRLFNLIM